MESEIIASLYRELLDDPAPALDLTVASACDRLAPSGKEIDMNNRAAAYGPWFVNDEGCLIIKREMFDEFGDHSGYELLDGDYDEIAHAIQMYQRINKAMAA